MILTIALLNDTAIKYDIFSYLKIVFCVLWIVHLETKLK
jgi:hypothetical protein